jgi:hypothetical protein
MGGSLSTGIGGSLYSGLGGSLCPDFAAQEVELMNSFKKAFSACLEGKGYTVK